MKKNGFTLIEILAVVVLLAGISLIALPLIINRANQSKSSLSDISKKLIYEAAYTYIDKNQTKYPFKEGRRYCVKLQTLVDYGYLKEPVQDIKTGESIDLKKQVEISFDTLVDIEYAVKDICTEIR